MHSKKISQLPLAALGNELEALKLKYVRRNGDPDEIIRAVPLIINKHAQNIVVAGEVTEPSQIRDIGEFAVNFSYLVGRACEMRHTSYECHTDIRFETEKGSVVHSAKEWESILEQGDAFSFVDPTSASIANRDNAPNGEKKRNQTTDRHGHGTFFRRRFKFDPSVPQIIISPQACHSVLSLAQLYLKFLLSSEFKEHVYSGHIRLQHLNGVAKTLLLLRSYHRYAFFNPVDLQSADESIVRCNELIRRFIAKYKLQTRQQARGSGKSSSALLVPSNALINSLELLCESVDLQKENYGTFQDPSIVRLESQEGSAYFLSEPSVSRISATSKESMKYLLPIQSKNHMENQWARYRSVVTETLETLKEMHRSEFDTRKQSKRHGHDSIFNTRDASSTISVFAKIGIVDRDLLFSCLNTLRSSAREISSSSLASTLYNCGVLGMSINDHESLPRIAKSLSENERLEAKLLRTVSMAGAMLGGFDSKVSGLAPTTLERWWKRLACNQNASAPLHVLSDIGHSMRVMNIESNKANYLIAKKIEMSDGLLRNSGQANASVLDNEPLQTLLKTSYMLGNTYFDKRDAEWQATTERVTRRVLSVARNQVKSKSIIHNDSVIGGLSTLPRIHLPFRSPTDEFRSDKFDSLESQFEGAMRFCSLKEEHLVEDITQPKTEKSSERPKITECEQTLLRDALDEALESAFDNSPSPFSDLKPQPLVKKECPLFTEESLFEAVREEPKHRTPHLSNDCPSESHQEENPGTLLSCPPPAEAKLIQNPHITSLGCREPLPSSSLLDPNAQFLISTQWSLLSRAEVIDRLSSIKPNKLDEESIFALVQRVADNVDGDALLQKEISRSMTSIFVALRGFSDSIHVKRLVELMSLLDVIGEPLGTVSECFESLIPLVQTLCLRVPDLTRTQANELVPVMESLLSVFIVHPEHFKLQAVTDRLLSTLSSRFTGLS